MRTFETRVLVRSVLLVLAIAVMAQAGPTAPCDVTDTFGIPLSAGALVIRSPLYSFCVSDYGFSNAWFPTDATIAAYDASKNTLGSSAQFITYDIGGADYGYWLSPQIFGSADLSLYVDTGSPFTLVTPIAYLFGFDEVSTQSVIKNDHVRITITSTAEFEGIRIVYQVLNISGESINDLAITQYFEYYPAGVQNTDVSKLDYRPILTLEKTLVNGLWSGYVGDPGLIEGGGTCGGWGTVCTTPDAHHIGTRGTGVGSTYEAVVTGIFNDVNTADNPAAGALRWDYGSVLAAGNTATFTLELVPEPGTWSLMGLGAALLLAAWRKRRA